MRAPLVLLAVCGISSAALAQTPLSAIDWLSESIKDPPEFNVPPDSTPLIAPILPDIFVKKGLDPVSPDAIGFLSPTLTGFSADLWGDMPATDIVELLSNFPNGGVPEAKNLFRRILLAQVNPAPDDRQDGLVLMARVDWLMKIGALDAAEALIALAPVSNAAIFQRKFEIALLTDRTAAVCETLKNTPTISSDLSTRVYCLARGGDWNAAAITLSLGGAIGAIDPAREEALIRFLDPELFEDAPDPEAPEPLGVMDFVLREAVLLPRPHGLMPLPYLYRDIGDRAPLRAKIEASERLVIAGSLPSNLLFAAYREGKAAASGGVWGRANAIQSLDNALAGGDDIEIAETVDEAYRALADAHLLHALAEEFAEMLSELPYSPKMSASRLQMLDLMYFANISNTHWSEGAVLDQNRQLAKAIVELSPLVEDPASSALLKSIVNGLEGDAPDNQTAKQLLNQLEQGQQGQVILASLRLLANGALADPEGVRTALYVLGAAGQSAVARRIAVQILLLPVGG